MFFSFLNDVTNNVSQTKHDCDFEQVVSFVYLGTTLKKGQQRSDPVSRLCRACGRQTSTERQLERVTSTWNIPKIWENSVNSANYTLFGFRNRRIVGR